MDSCPSEAIHPAASDATYEAATQLYINPEECMDCGACAAECPTNSIFAAEELPRRTRITSRARFRDSVLSCERGASPSAVFTCEKKAIHPGVSVLG
jgi:NAD-dependent dihydropyrimidine dehydrogenase PreA subunit